MTVVIVAEKPSQAKAYAAAFRIKNKTKTHIELEPCSTFKSGAFITWGIGHLVELKLPQETSAEVNTWHLDNLPYLPQKYEFKISKGKSEHFKSVKRLLESAHLIINACDVDREGSNIFYLILQYAGIKDKEVKRLWINSLEVDEVRSGFNNLLDNSKDILMFQEAKARMVSDYLIGMNLSPLYTLKFQSLGLDRDVFGIGRVQTPTLFMIYQRHEEIKKFKPENFYEIHADFSKDDVTYKGKMKLRDKNKDVVIDTLVDIQHETSASVTSIEKQKKKQSAPKLHALSTLQTTANKKWKYSPKETLKIVQSLYEKKLVTYPRTDSQFITEQEFNYLKNNLNQYFEIYDLNPTVEYAEPRKRFVDGSKVQEHYAIVLTKNVKQADVKSLNEKELNIFKEIYSTTLAMFLPDYEYETTEVVTSIKNCDFYSKGKIDVALGWKSLFQNDPNEEADEDKLPKLDEGDIVQAKPSLYEGVTKPPKLYTEGQLINLMKSCGKQVEEQEDADILKDVEGIGTEATRADVIEKLQKHEYITVKKNKVEITKKGILLCKAVSGTLLSSAEMTAKWEKALKNISNGSMNFRAFIENVEKYLKHQISVIDDELETNNIKSDIQSVSQDKGVAECPKCRKGRVEKRKSKKGTNFYACNHTDCDFVIFENMAGAKLSQTHVKELITQKQTKNKVKNFKSKKGKRFDAYVELNDDFKTQFKF